MWITIAILAVAIIFFVTGKVRSDLVALCALLALLVFQILTPEEGLSGFSNSTVIMMVGLFIVGGGIFQTGLAKMISGKILKLAGKSETRLFLLVILTTAGIGAFVSNTGTVALMLPIVVSMAALAGANPSRLLMPLAFASSMGGMMTLIGTPPNLIVSDALASAGFDRLSFFSFLPVGLICVAVGVVVLMPLSKKFLTKRRKSENSSSGSKSLNELVNEYGLSVNLFRVRIPQDSEVVGKTMGSLDLRNRYGLNILEIRRQDNVQQRFMRTVKQYSAPDTVLDGNDVLYLSGDRSQVQRFADDCRLTLMDDHSTEETGDTASLDFYDIGIAEVLLMSSARVNNHTVREAGEPSLLRVAFKPKKALPGFDDYYAYLTPKTHKVAKICACAKDAVEPGGSWRRHYLIEALEKRYGAWARLISYRRPYYAFDVAPGRTVTVCLAGASQDYQTVLTAWDDALVRLADEEEEALRKEARKAAAKRRDQQVQDAASIF